MARKKAGFIHIPKTAGVCISSHLEQSNIESGDKIVLLAAHHNVSSQLKKISFNSNANDGSLKNIFEIGQISIYDNIEGSNSSVKMFIDPHEISLSPYSEFLFSFVRNPWDRFVSAYFYLCSRAGFDDEYKKYIQPFKCFKDFAKNGSIESLHFKPQSMWLDSPVDFIGKFENLQSDFNKLCCVLGLPTRTLSIKNKSEHLPYWEYYDKESKMAVAEKYSEDIKRFEYHFKLS